VFAVGHASQLVEESSFLLTMVKVNNAYFLCGWRTHSCVANEKPLVLERLIAFNEHMQ
jgi:hypothetical protein